MKRIGVFLLCFVAVLTTISAQTHFMGNFETIGVENGYEWVDLGLPSGLKWATCNVGATKAEEYGNYYAWGETTPKTTYDWSTYKWCNGSRNTMTKYCTDSDYGTVDNKTVLDPEDDAAAVNMGGKWRMPTDEEFLELRNLCRWERTKKGYKVIGPNGSSIFLSTDYSREVNYWTSSLDLSDSSEANGLYLISGGSQYRYFHKKEKIEVMVYGPNSDLRYCSSFVRGVCE